MKLLGCTKAINKLEQKFSTHRFSLVSHTPATVRCFDELWLENTCVCWGQLFTAPQNMCMLFICVFLYVLL